MHKAYHAHIYFGLDELALAESIRQRMIDAIPALTYKGVLISKLVGPHPKPMFELHFPAEVLAETMATLDQLRNHLAILIHPVHDEYLKAHTAEAIWLGNPLTLNVAVFDLLKQRDQ